MFAKRRAHTCSVDSISFRWVGWGFFQHVNPTEGSCRCPQRERFGVCPGCDMERGRCLRGAKACSEANGTRPLGACGPVDGQPFSADVGLGSREITNLQQACNKPQFSSMWARLQIADLWAFANLALFVKARKVSLAFQALVRKLCLPKKCVFLTLRKVSMSFGPTAGKRRPGGRS